MNIEIVDVTPELARTYLANVGAQRNIKQHVVKMYAADMRKGLWTQDSNALCFDTESRLINGQHRLRAVIESGMTIRFAIMRGLPAEAILHMDSGTPRTPGDQIAIQGIPNGTHIAAIVRLLLMYETAPGAVWAGSSTRHLCTAAGRLEYAMEHTELLQMALHEVRPLAKARFNLTSMASLYCIVATQSNNRDSWEPFLAGLISGTGLTATDPRLALRAYFTRPGLRAWGGGQSHLLIGIRAWNKYVSDEDVRLFKMPRREELPMPKVL